MPSVDARLGRTATVLGWPALTKARPQARMEDYLIMRNHTKLLLAALTAAVFMSLAVGSASARRIEVSERNFLAAWNPLHFRDEGGHNVACGVTLDGSFHSRTISKVSGQLVGLVNQAIVANCSPGTGRALTETLPWHIQYNSFSGVLPRIETLRIQMVGAKFRVTEGSLGCLSATTQASPGFGDINVEAGGKVTSMRALEEFTIPLTGEFGLCSFASPGRFEGEAVVSSSAAGRPAITVRLVQ